MTIAALSWDKLTTQSTESNLIITDDNGNTVGVRLLGNEEVIEPVINKLRELAQKIES